MKSLLFLFFILLQCSNDTVEKTISENKEDLSEIDFKVLTRNNELSIINLEILINKKDYFETEPMFIYLHVGYVDKNICKRVTINFNLSKYDVSKGVRLISFNKSKIIIDIETLSLKKLNTLSLHYNDKKKYSSMLWFGNTQELLGESYCN